MLHHRAGESTRNSGSVVLSCDRDAHAGMVPKQGTVTVRPDIACYCNRNRRRRGRYGRRHIERTKRRMQCAICGLGNRMEELIEEGERGQAEQNGADASDKAVKE